jgi:DNA-binding IclR family transcriptional regulator
MATEVEDPALACARDVLDAVAARSCDGGATIAQIVEGTGRNRSVVNRLLLDLAGLGLVERDPSTRRVRLDWTWYVVAVRVGQHRLLRQGQGVIDHLSAEVGETAYLVVREGRSAVTRAESIPVHRSIQAASWVGRSWPIARSDAGPSLLIDVDPAELPVALGRGSLTRGGAATNAPRTFPGFAALIDEARRRGYSALDEQTEAGVASVAAPV